MIIKNYHTFCGATEIADFSVILDAIPVISSQFRFIEKFIVLITEE